MAEKKYYCLCGSNCRYETLTKEQIYAAIMQAVENGTIGDVDTGFVTTIKTINGNPLKFFVGEQHEYEQLTEEQRENLFAIITNDTTKEGLLATLEEHSETLEQHTENWNNFLKNVIPNMEYAFRLLGSWETGESAVPKAAKLAPTVHKTLTYTGANTQCDLDLNSVYLVEIKTAAAVITTVTLAVGATMEQGWSSAVGSDYQNAYNLYKCYYKNTTNGNFITIYRANLQCDTGSERNFKYFTEAATLRFIKIADYPA